MTESQLRQEVLRLLQSCVGATRGDATHKSIIDTYNSHKPLPRGVRMSYTMDWCAATVSAAAIVNNITDIMPVECSCGEMMRTYQAMGRWVEDDAYVPQPGDVVFYAWGDTGSGDCRLAPNHVGVVETVDTATGAMTILEGNMGSGSKMGRRPMTINGRYIRGYGIPDYASKAEKPPVPEAGETSPWYAAAQSWAKDLGVADGTRPEDICTRAEVWQMLLNYDRAFQEARRGE